MTTEANREVKQNARTDEELKKLAIDIHKGAVFGSWAVEESMLTMVFMALSLMDKSAIQDIQKYNPVHLYEYINKALPRGINGYPMFTSFSMLNKEEWATVRMYIEKLRAAEAAL